MKNPVCLGDATSHGGKVITASPTFDFEGRPAALLYDLVSCLKHGDNLIVEAGDDLLDGERSQVDIANDERFILSDGITGRPVANRPYKIQLLAELGDTVKQRMLARGTPVGDAPGVKKFGTLPLIQKPVPGVDPSSFWNGNRNVLTPLMKLWAVPNANKTVTVNAEEVPHPLQAEEMKNFEMSRADAPEMGQWNRDPKDPNRGQYDDESYRFYRSLYEPKSYMTANALSPLGVSVARQTQDEMLQQHDTYHAEPTNHSTLPMHQPFMGRVVAYDLPIGFCDAYEKRDLWLSLMKQADWTRGRDPYFETGVLETVAKPAMIDWDTAGEALNRIAIEDLKSQTRGLPPRKSEDIVYGD
jgi:PAAR motif